MAANEKSALGRTLLISKEAFAEMTAEELTLNPLALLDALSAALSHAGSEKAPLSSVMSDLKREIKTKNKWFYPKARLYFKKTYPAPDFDYEKALRHIPAIIYGSDLICKKIVNGEGDKAKSMCEAMKSYPGFLMGEFSSLTDKQFYDLVFGYYPKLYDEDFMGEMETLFTS